jgi:glycosyltransferase involved in cell wall biosynthesis
MTTICIIDVLGTPYDGSTLSKRGLGGSESAVILVSRELVKLGFSVTVLNNCTDNKTSSGVYDGVTYWDVSTPIYNTFDIVISSRSIVPFVPRSQWSNFHTAPFFEHIKNSAKLKILWMHDTFCNGDNLLEELVVNGDIDELFTLSDFHTTYVTNCNHGRKRNYEVLKNKIFQTRNGVVNHIKEVDIRAKDKDLFVFNSSVTKGLMPLLNMWNSIREKIPAAKLKVIGGYYRFKNDGTDAQYEQWEKVANDPHYKQLDVEFTGIIRQDEIAQILAKASFMIYPCIFPETFGISAVESLCYNTPLLTARFGALEETAIEQASYMIDYPLEPNGLFPDVNTEQQLNKFVSMVQKARGDEYLHQQKMYYCNIIKDVCEWDTVALQWKQHFFKKLNLYLSAEEYRKVSYINDRVHKIFGRRYSNREEWNVYKTPENPIAVIIPFYNCKEYIEKCIRSVMQQDYDNYTVWLINDCSTDSTVDKARNIIDGNNKYTIIHKKENSGAVKNQVETIKQYLPGNTIVILLDGDDAFVNDNNIFNFYNNLYNNGAEFTYGSCWSEVDNIPLISQPYPEEIKQAKKYRDYKFNWNMPYTHTRTFRAELLHRCNDSNFKDENSNWFKAGGDNAVFYSVLEQANPDKVVAVSDVFYLYNDKNPLNDYKVNAAEQTKNANYILKKKQPMKTILIAVPTAKNIEAETFRSIYNLYVPEGYKTQFQYFYGYNIDQVRNLIADWGKKYDYLFCVDSDIVLPEGCLDKMLFHNKDIISGMYIQRNPNQHILEIYEENDHGGFSNIPFEKIKGKGLVEIAACGFGSVLINSNVLKTMEYPHFHYKSAIDHKDTFSEDLYFCRKAKDHGFKIYCDTAIYCDHIGQTTFTVSV